MEKVKFLYTFFIVSFVGLLQATTITVVGCGYVGLVMAGVFSQAGHTIVAVDIDKEKIDALQHKVIPIYEPHLASLLFNEDNPIKFTDDIQHGKDAEYFFICVPTPTENGTCNTAFLKAAFKNIIGCLKPGEKRVLCVKSTVPPGTIRPLFEQVDNTIVDVIHNPEFLREGSAIEDIYHNNPVVIGGESHAAIQKIEKLYSAFLPSEVKVIKTNFETAELIKYAWNSFSAIRISYINELSLLCKVYKANIMKIIEAVALSENLLPTSVLKPGPGYGGSCLPKDTASFATLLENNGFDSSMVHQAIQSNENHKRKIIKTIMDCIEKIDVPTIALLGLSFKANTNDIRYSPAIDIIRALSHKKATIKAYDPKAVEDMRQLFPLIQYVNSPYDAVRNADCIVALTEWEQIREIDLSKVAALCNKKVIIDTRNIYDPQALKQYGFDYVNLGRV